jgi:hypothetical protein
MPPVLDAVCADKKAKWFWKDEILHFRMTIDRRISPHGSATYDKTLSPILQDIDFLLDQQTVFRYHSVGS